MVNPAGIRTALPKMECPLSKASQTFASVDQLRHWVKAPISASSALRAILDCCLAAAEIRQPDIIRTHTSTDIACDWIVHSLMRRTVPEQQYYAPAVRTDRV